MFLGTHIFQGNIWSTILFDIQGFQGPVCSATRTSIKKAQLIIKRMLYSAVTVNTPNKQLTSSFSPGESPFSILNLLQCSWPSFSGCCSWKKTRLLFQACFIESSLINKMCISGWIKSRDILIDTCCQGIDRIFLKLKSEWNDLLG